MDISPEEWIENIRQVFPDLRFEITSPVDFNYNCLSWALGSTTQLFGRSKGEFWTWNFPDDTAEGWARLVELHGFERTESVDFERGYEKIAILQNTSGDLHACRSDQRGAWKSKLGDRGPDIDHEDLDGLRPGYGEVVLVLKRHRPDWGE